MTTATVASILGGATVLGRAVHTEVELSAEVQRGLPVASLTHLVEEFHPSLSPQSIFAVVGTKPALHGEEPHRERLSASQSERLVRLARLAVRAREALGDRDIAYQWLGKPNRALEGRRPVELLDTDDGATVVQDVLGRIEHGVYG